MSGLDEAIRLKRAGDLDAAVIALEGELSRSPRQPVALLHLADAQLRRGRAEQAADALDRAEAMTGVTAQSARLRGDVLYRAQAWDDAARCYADADALGDTGTWSLVQLARCRLRLRDLEGARGAATRALERDQTSAPVLVALGDVAGAQGLLDEAEAMYERAHNHHPGDEWAYAKLVETRLARLEPDQREREVKVLLKTSRSNKHLMGVLARIQSEQGNEEAAAEVWAARARTGDAYARKQHGFALKKAGRLEEAATVLSACLLAEPDDRYVFSSYVSLQKKRGAFDELRQTLEEALPRAGRRKGAYHGEIRKLPPPGESETTPSP